MAQNITIAGASYSGVPRIDVPKTGGGIASFEDAVNAKATLSEWLTDNGVTVPSGASLDALVALLDDVEVGGGGAAAAPIYSYSGQSQLIDEGGGNWKLMLKSSGNLTFTELGNAANGIEIFCVGAGGGCSGGSTQGYGAAGGSGYTSISAYTPAVNTQLTVTIGSGGNGGNGSKSGSNGGQTSVNVGNATIAVAAGGYGGDYNSGAGGNGGSGGAGYSSSNTLGGTDGNDGQDGGYPGGKGQRSVPGPNGESGSTREFGSSSGTLYARGGNAGTNGAATVANTGNGGDSNSSRNSAGRAGASGVVIIRNRRS